MGGKCSEREQILCFKNVSKYMSIPKRYFQENSHSAAGMINISNPYKNHISITGMRNQLI